MCILTYLKYLFLIKKQNKEYKMKKSEISIQNIQPRCFIDLSLHVLEIMHGILEAAQTSQNYQTITKCERPKVLKEEEIITLKIK